MASKHGSLVGLSFAGMDEASVSHTKATLNRLRVQLFELGEMSAPMDDTTLDKLKQQELTMHSETEVTDALSLIIRVIEDGGFCARPKAEPVKISTVGATRSEESSSEAVTPSWLTAG